ncbi:MAG: hypothetical protein Q8784_00085 [Vigna little leaf phytoplasma]|nr:hypothetical protein [Vigna little leaf phytoplasma]
MKNKKIKDNLKFDRNIKKKKYWMKILHYSFYVFLIILLLLPFFMLVYNGLSQLIHLLKKSE